MRNSPIGLCAYDAHGFDYLSVRRATIVSVANTYIEGSELMTVDEGRLGERFRDRRKAKKKTQQDAAKEIGVGPRTVQNFESGAATPQPANLRKMLRWAGLEEEELPEGTELTERAWPKEVSVFLDVIAAYLMTFEEEERLRRIHEVTRQIFVTRHEN